jgi:hypothetical protein
MGFTNDSSSDIFAGVFSSILGNNKIVITSSVTILHNVLSIYCQPDTAGNKIKLKSIRLFVLSVGSQIALDFANLTADQLNIKYPF